MKAGFAVAPITPTPPVFLAGFGARTEPAHDVHEDLEARALHLSDAGTDLCLVVCDLLGMTPDVSTPIREAIAGELGIPRANVIVACTHTHSGPSLIAGSEAIGWPTPEGYAELVGEGCVSAAAKARDATAEAELRFARAPLPDGFAFNRRGGDYENPTFSVLHVPQRGVVANLGIHPVLLGPQWMAVATDWVGPFRSALERIAGGTALELTGALGDVNPTPPAGLPDDTYAPWASAEHTVRYGERLAQAVAEALDDADPIDLTSGESSADTSGARFPRSVLSVLRAETIEVPVGGTALAAAHGQPTMLVELVEWSIGDIRVVSVPGEAFHGLGREISSVRGDRALLAGIAPWHGYLPHPFTEGYEEGVSYGKDAVAEIRESLLAAPRPAAS